MCYLFIPCYICGKRATERHHVFGGARRKHSEKYHLVAHLCHECHRTGRHAVHRNREMADRLHRDFQEKFELDNSRYEFMQIFGKNYL